MTTPAHKRRRRFRRQVSVGDGPRSEGPTRHSSNHRRSSTWSMGSKKKQQNSSTVSAAFELYVNSLPFAIDHSTDQPPPATTSLTPIIEPRETCAALPSLPSVESGRNVLCDDMSVADLLKRIGTERNPQWTQEEISADAEILQLNRIRNVGELRILSKHSWKEIKLLPIVKDLIIDAIKMSQKDGMKKEKKNFTKRQKHIKNVSEGDANIARTEEATDGLSRLELMENSDDSSNSDETEGNRTITADGPPSIEILAQKNSSVPRPGSIKTISISRMKVAADNGKIYEVNRICPHKHADMSQGKVRGTLLYCPKHDWAFDMAAGGACREKGKGGKSLQACLVNDW